MTVNKWLVSSINVFFGSPLFSYTTSVIPACIITLAQTLQGYSVVYNVHPSTFGPPTIALYSACVTVILYDKSCDTMHATPLYNQHSLTH